MVRAPGGIPGALLVSHCSDASTGGLWLSDTRTNELRHNEIPIGARSRYPPPGPGPPPTRSTPSPRAAVAYPHLVQMRSGVTGLGVVAAPPSGPPEPAPDAVPSTWHAPKATLRCRAVPGNGLAGQTGSRSRASTSLRPSAIWRGPRWIRRGHVSPRRTASQSHAEHCGATDSWWTCSSVSNASSIL